jgi:hypothetical protein
MGKYTDRTILGRLAELEFEKECLKRGVLIFGSDFFFLPGIFRAMALL